MHWREFKKRVARYFEHAFETELRKNQEWQVGQNNAHKFDLVSKQGDIIIECKSYTWVNGENIPPAKISKLNETVLFLNRADARKRMIVVQDDHRSSDGKSLTEYYVERYSRLINEVEVWSYLPEDTLDSDKVELRRESSAVDYDEL